MVLFILSLKDLLTEDKTINRRALGRRVFGNQVIWQVWLMFQHITMLPNELLDYSTACLQFTKDALFHAGAVKSPNRHCMAWDCTSGKKPNKSGQRRRYYINLNLFIIILWNCMFQKSKIIVCHIMQQFVGNEFEWNFWSVKIDTSSL